jgi:hypothetical protein
VREIKNLKTHKLSEEKGKVGKKEGRKKRGRKKRWCPQVTENSDNKNLSAFF